MVEGWIRWEAFYRHDELPFVCPRSAVYGQKVSSLERFLRAGGLLSFPRTGCALRAEVSLSRADRDRVYGLTSATRSGGRTPRADGFHSARNCDAGDWTRSDCVSMSMR